MEPLALGPFVIPGFVIHAAIALIPAFAAAWLWTRSDGDTRKTTVDLLSTALLIFVLLWKLGPLLSSPALVLEEPRLLLFGRGGSTGVIVGAVGVREGVFPADAPVFAVAPDAAAFERAEHALGARLAGQIKADADLCAEAIIKSAPSRSNGRTGWHEEVQTALANRDVEPIPPTGEGVVPRDVADALQAVVEKAGDAVYVADGGEFGQWMQGFIFAPARVMNGASGAIASAFGNAIGAQVARPGATVICTCGDGTAGFYLGELDTAVRAGANAIFVIGNDARWNAEHMLQLRQFGPDRLTGCDLLPTRYDLAAAGLGCHGEHVTHADELAPALERALASGKPAVINIKLDAQPAPVFAKDAAGAH